MTLSEQTKAKVKAAYENGSAHFPPDEYDELARYCRIHFALNTKPSCSNCLIRNVTKTYEQLKPLGLI